MPKNTISHYFEYAALRTAQAVFNLLPRKLTLAAGACLGSCLYYCGIYRSVVRKNMEFTGIVDAAQQKVITKKLYRNMGRYGSEFLRPSQKLPPYSVEHLDIAQSINDAGKGSIVVLAHFGNWELLAAIFGSQFHDLNVLAKPMHNQIVERWLYSKRTGSHVTPIYTSKAVRSILQVLKRNGMVSMLIDQNPGRNGTPSVFLGKPANTVRTVAGMLYKMECGIIFAYALLENNGKYRIVIEEGPHLDISRDNQEQFIEAYQRAHNDVLSRWITRYPEHYFGWFHRRFRGFLSYKS